MPRAGGLEAGQAARINSGVVARRQAERNVPGGKAVCKQATRKRGRDGARAGEPGRGPGKKANRTEVGPVSGVIWKAHHGPDRGAYDRPNSRSPSAAMDPNAGVERSSSKLRLKKSVGGIGLRYRRTTLLAWAHRARSVASRVKGRPYFFLSPSPLEPSRSTYAPPRVR